MVSVLLVTQVADNNVWSHMACDFL